jgi:hypothetical protein
MNVLQMRGFDAQIEIMGKAVDVSYRDNNLTIHGLSLANVHAILGALASGEVVQEDGDALLTKPKRAATDEAGKANDGAPPKAKGTRRRKPKEAPEPKCKACGDSGVNSRGNPCAACRPEDAADDGPADAEVAASMRDELEGDAPEPENPCSECGGELGDNHAWVEGNEDPCATCTAYEKKGRDTTARIRNKSNSGKGTAAKPNPQPQPDPPPQVPEADDFLAPEGGVPEELVTAKRLRQVVAYMLDNGIKKEEDIVAECLRIKDQVPAIQRVSNLPERIGRTLAVMDTGQL